MGLLTLAAERISFGLKRTTLTKCSDWTQEYRVMGAPFPGPYRFKYFPWSREIHDYDAEMIVSQKAAQMSLTESAMNRAFYRLDMFGDSVLYVLPTSRDASNFSSSRFSPALETSLHLKNLFSDTSNTGHKRAGHANLFIRGSRSVSGLKSDPCGILIFDEVDEMFTQNISLAMERSAGQIIQMAFLLSTPTFENMGINVYFKRSDQCIFTYKCPYCSRLTNLDFPDCLEITAEDLMDPAIKGSFLKCKECTHKLEHETKYQWLADGVWAPQVSNTDIRGYKIPQLYSSTVTPIKLAQKFLRGLTNPHDEQQWYNSALGETYEAEGARVTDDQIEQAIGSHLKSDSCAVGSIVTMGVDVGKFLHIEIDRWLFDPAVATTDVNVCATCIVIQETKIVNFEELDDFMRAFNVNFCVIDRAPEFRKAMEFARRWWGLVKLCNYTTNSTKSLSIQAEEEHSLNADRSFWLDLALQSRFTHNTIALPIDCSLEYKKHIKANVRVIEKNASGINVASYVKQPYVEDHFAHTRNYCEIALPLAVGTARAEDIRGLW